jgi:hypothetical protein
MSLSQINPDLQLKEWLNEQITIVVSDTESRKATVYAQGERPNTGLPDEFIEILYNGTIRSLTKPIGVLQGNLAVTIYCKAQPNGTAKFNRVESVMEQLGRLLTNKVTGGFFFEIDLKNIVTPTYIDAATGYSTTTLNVKWHTTDSKYLDMYVTEQTLEMDGNLRVEDKTLYIQ